MSLPFAAALIAIGLATLALAPRTREAQGFFFGASASGEAPKMWTLALSQVTTWIFARSLMNAAILGYFFGYAGVLAYAAYYLSFFTGAVIVDQIRFRHGYASVQDFLAARFGRVGAGCYNLTIGVRLLSEVFANLLVVGLLFGSAGDGAWTLAIIVAALATLAYSMMGGLRASLRTDVFQCGLLIVLLAVLSVCLVALDGFSAPALFTTSPDLSNPGWVLLLVAAMQVWSYPLHDPVMIDRGLLADRQTTRKSFVHAGWISIICILAFGMLGVYGGIMKLDGEGMMDTWTRVLGQPEMTLLALALIISAASTLDSTLSSAAKLAVVDMKVVKTPSLANGRIAMAGFLAGGLIFLFIGSKDLFAAVAVSGTVSLYLFPVILFSILLDRPAAVWSYAVSFAAAVIGGALYMLKDTQTLDLIGPLTGLEHKYSQLAVICVVVLAVGIAAFLAGGAAKRR